MGFGRQTAQSIADNAEPGQGKVIVITGASSGIGLSAAIALANHGWNVICAVRNVDKMEACISKEKESVKQNILIMKCDLESLESTSKFGKELLLKAPKIDVLLLNAGLASTSYHLTKDGFERTFQSNHLGHFLLIKLLEQRMIESAPSRIVLVSSVGHTYAPQYDWPTESNPRGFQSDEAVWRKKYATFPTYCSTKLMNIHTQKVLCKRLEGKDVSVYSLHPGAVGTSIWPKFIQPLTSLFMLTPDAGAATSVYCATSAKVENNKYYEPSGLLSAFFADGMPVEGKITDRAQDLEEATRLWEVSEKFVSQYL